MSPHPHHSHRKVSTEMIWAISDPQDSSFSTLTNFLFHAQTLRGPRWALLLGVTNLRLWSVWKVYWACPLWVLGMTEYIDTLSMAIIVTMVTMGAITDDGIYWPDGDQPARGSVRFGGVKLLPCDGAGSLYNLPPPKLHIWKQPQCLSPCITATNVNRLKWIFLG